MAEKQGFVKEITTGLPAWAKGVIAVTVIGGGGYAIYTLVKKLNEIKETKLKKDAETTTSADNPWSYTAFIKALPVGTKLIRYATSSSLAKQVYDALNTYFDDDEDKVIQVFSSLESQAMVAQVAETFEKLYKRNILHYLQNGNKTFDLGTGGLSDEDYTKILENVKNKPKYTK
jgi:hypothetical protein